MGVEDIERMRSLLVDLGRDHTVVLIEHNVTLVMDVCQTVTVLDRGRVLVEGPPEVVSQDSRVREAYLGVGI
jgi:branched-chain amino acid transport system ATP-binding protein